MLLRRISNEFKSITEEDIGEWGPSSLAQSVQFSPPHPTALQVVATCFILNDLHKCRYWGLPSLKDLLPFPLQRFTLFPQTAGILKALLTISIVNSVYSFERPCIPITALNFSNVKRSLQKLQNELRELNWDLALQTITLSMVLWLWLDLY